MKKSAFPFSFLRVLAAWVLILCGLAACVPASADAEDTLRVRLPEKVKGYTPCEIHVFSPVAGEADFLLYDRKDNLWLIRHESVSAGETVLQWDGLGANEERLMAGPYHFRVTLRADDGRELTAKAPVYVSSTTPALVYALPSSEVLYQDGTVKWFTECYVSASCTVRMEVSDGTGIRYFREFRLTDPDGMSVSWNGTDNDRQPLPPGDYTVSFNSLPNPAYRVSFPLRIEAAAPPVPEIGPTGAVVPERGMTDAEIWEIMMKPSVVVQGNPGLKRVSVHAEKSNSSPEVVSLRCALQAVEIIDTDGTWAHVRAWSNADGSPGEGYILLNKLMVVYPSAHYGLLIDKRDQTMTVYEDGVPIGTVLVSTGLADARNKYRETAAGAFVTGPRLGASFAQEGYRYEYPIRYDGGNMIHGVGFIRIGRDRDYSRTLPKLGQKASHGCVRVSSFVTDDCPINIYWLWTHLPYHTRVIILDD